jgi:hypothetical protein
VNFLFSAITSERDGNKSKFGQKFMTVTSAFALASFPLGLDPVGLPIKLSVYATAGCDPHRPFQSSQRTNVFHFNGVGRQNQLPWPNVATFLVNLCPNTFIESRRSNGLQRSSFVLIDLGIDKTLSDTHGIFPRVCNIFLHTGGTSFPSNKVNGIDTEVLSLNN